MHAIGLQSGQFILPHLFTPSRCTANTSTQIQWMKQHLTFPSYSYALMVMCDNSVYTLGIQAVWAWAVEVVNKECLWGCYIFPLSVFCSHVLGVAAPWWLIFPHILLVQMHSCFFQNFHLVCCDKMICEEQAADVKQIKRLRERPMF